MMITKSILIYTKENKLLKRKRIFTINPVFKFNSTNKLKTKRKFYLNIRREKRRKKQNIIMIYLSLICHIMCQIDKIEISKFRTP